MKAAILQDVKKIEVKDVPVPECPADGLVLKVKACAVCGTDFKIYNYGHIHLTLPRVLGHETAGIIEEVGADAGDFKRGSRVAVAAVVNCLRCEFCRAGNCTMCATLEAFGYHYDGGFEEYMVVPAKAIAVDCVNEIPENVSFEEASLAEPLACCIHGQKLSGVELGKSVAVVGAGPLGSMHAQLAKNAGAHPVILIDVEPKRLEMAAFSEPTFAIDASKDDPVKKVMELTEGKGVDCVITACSAKAAQQYSLELVARCGSVNFFGGLPKTDSVVELDTNLIHYKECYVVGTHGSAAIDNKNAIRLIASGRVNVKPLVSRKITIDQLEATLASKPDITAMKTIVTP
jgi:L-iditol 2-dehydrogenase